MGATQVRRMRVDDIEACAQIVAGERLWQRYGLTLQRARRVLRRAQASRRRGGAPARAVGDLAVASEGGRVLGFIWFHRTGTFRHSGYIQWVAVAPTARGRGVGSGLMRYAEERILKKGPNVLLLVAAFNSRAQAFYKKLGYARVGAIPDYMVRGVTELLYRKTKGPVSARDVNAENGQGGSQTQRPRRGRQ
ncbi:MAG: GNAT family N-acetyltransferase [Armatimonadetes bacterium]|nr:GNAT family N-acetyltransferase [Armatimonadota bacterium]